MEEKQILGIPYTEFGSTIKIAGMLLEGNDKAIMVRFPEAESKNYVEYELDHNGWKELLFQLDVVETQILDPNNKSQKIIVRKSQREIEQQVNWNVFKRDNYTCRYCGNDHTPLTVDHIVLWERMGASVEDNLITACRKCNKTRGNMLYEDWLKSDYYKKVMLARGDIYIGGGRTYHHLNVEALDTAEKVPLRVTKRGR